MKRTFGLLAATAGLTLTACSPSTKTINAAGATFPAPLYIAWSSEYKEITGNQINYQSVGSGAGVRQYVANTIDFGASDAAVPDGKIPEQGVVQVPTTGGAIAVIYNESSCPDNLSLTQKQLADIFHGKILNWNEVGCGDKIILPVFRSDGSGTTKGFTASLSAFSEDWKKEVGAGKAVSWPAGVGAKGNSGVAAQVQQASGSIGYVNFGYVASVSATTNVAAIQNASGEFIVPSARSASVGLAGIVLDEQLRGYDPNPAGTGAYPIVSLTWILAYPEHPKNESIKEFLLYILSDEAQEKCEELGYVPLPVETRLAAIERVKGLK